MPTDWSAIASAAGTATDEHFKSKISSLTRLNDDEVDSLIHESGISKQNLAEVLKVVKDATKSNETKAQAIENIGKGVDVLVSIAAKLI